MTTKSEKENKAFYSLCIKLKNEKEPDGLILKTGFSVNFNQSSGYTNIDVDLLI